jgi:hypothetical protein
MTTKTFHFTSPSNQHIVIDNKYTYHDINTIEDLKYLFTLKNRLYTPEMFEIAVNDNILDLTTKLDNLDVNMYQIIHIYKPKLEDSEQQYELEIKKPDNIEVKINQFVTNEEVDNSQVEIPQLETTKVEVKSSRRCIVM